MINGDGGVNGQKLEVMFFDIQSVAENGRVGAEKLIQAGAQILIGAGDSGATIAVLQVAERAKVPLVVDVAVASQITESGFKYVFRNFPDAATLIRGVVVAIRELLSSSNVKPKTATLIHVNDAFGGSMAKGVKAMWGPLQVPVEIVETIPYDPTARDLSVEISKAKAVNADLLLPVTRTLDAIQIVREMVKQDFNPMGILCPGSPGSYHLDFTKALGKYGDFVLASVPWYDPTSPLTKTVAAAVKRDYPDHRFDLDIAFGFDSLLIVADAFRKARSTASAALHEALKTTDLVEHLVYGGPIRFNEKGQNVDIGTVMLQNRDGAPRVVFPTKIAEIPYVFPVPKWSQR